jgi:AraC-like DNA-binding protein
LLTPIAVGYFEALDIAASVVINAKSPIWFPVYRARRGFDPLQFERRFDRDRARDRYNRRMLRRSARARAPLIGEHNGFCDLFVPVHESERCVAWLVAGPFARTPPTVSRLSSSYESMSGAEPRSTDAELGAFIRVALDTVTLDGTGLRELETFARAFARIAAGDSQKGDLFALTELRERALKRHLHALMWQTAAGLVDRFENPLWRSRSIRGTNLVVLGVSRMPTDVICALPEQPELPGAQRLDYLLRARSFQQQCTRLAAEQPDLLCGRLSDDGIFVLARSEHRLSASKRRATLSVLMRSFQTVARATLGAQLRFGVSRHVTSTARLPAAHAEALFALDWAMHRRSPCVFFEEGDRPTGADFDVALRSLCEAVESGDPGRVTIAVAQAIREVLWRAGGNAELGRGYFEMGVGELVRHLERRALLEESALRSVETAFREDLAEASVLSQLANVFDRRVKALAEGAVRPARAERAARLDRAIDLVLRNLAGDVSRAAVAKECGLSPSHFSRLFAARHGVGFERFVIQARVDEAKRLLRSTDHPVQRVASTCGFSSYAHLAKAFRRETGTSPREFRRADPD